MREPLLYFDNNATTRLDPAVLEAMLPFLHECYGNAGSAHSLGHLSEGALVEARERVATLLGCAPAEIVFNGGGTEGLNHAFRGVFEAFPAKRHFVATAVEHSAVMAILAWLRAQGAEVTLLGVDGQGRLDLAELEAALRPDTALVSVMAANNETGALFPLPEIARIVKGRGILFHVDATQILGRLPLDLASLPADLVNLSGHKLHGPKGTGALFIRRGLRLKPFMLGGHQERGRRAGTENVPGLVGLGRAAELALEHLPGAGTVQRLRDRLEATVLARIPDVRVQAGETPRLPNTSLLSFHGLEGEALQLRLAERGVCASTGSACTTGQREPSHVLRAMGVPFEWASGTLRLSLSRFTTEGEVDAVLEALPGLVEALRRDRVRGVPGTSFPPA